jgi:hypothetical protein
MDRTDMADRNGPTEKINRRVVLALALFPALLYANTLWNSFHYDDIFLILKNSHVREFSGVGHFFVSPELISDLPLSGYRPLTMTSFSLNYAVGGGRAAGYHLVNVAIHVANVLLVYAVALALMRAIAVSRSRYAALAVALLFAAHPINTQPVNYISGRSTLLVGFFSLLCFLLFARSREEGRAGRRAALVAGSLAAYLCALLSKEEAVALPGLLAAYEFCRARFRLDGASIRRIVVGLLPFAALTLVFLVFVVQIMGIVGDTRQARGVGENLLTQAKVLFIYIKMIALPTNLSIDHVVPACKSLFEPVAAASALGVVVLLGGSLLLARSAPIVPFGLWWMAITLIPSSTLVALKLVLNEQRLYVAAIGLLFMAGAGFGKALDHPGRGLQRALFGGLAALLLVCSALTVRRNAEWRDPLTVWSSALEKYPDSARANTQVASEYLKMDRVEDALALAKRAVEISPDVIEARLVLTKAYSQSGLYEDALEQARAAVDIDPLSTDARTELGTAYAELERWGEAEAAWKRAIELDPRNNDARANLERLISIRRVLEAPAK